MGLYQAFKTDESIEKQGVWLEYGEENGKPVRIRVARAGGHNKEYTKALEKATRPYRKAIQMGTLGNEVAEKLYKEVFAQTVILGWENVTDQAGAPMDFNEDNVMKLLNDLPDLYADIRDQANNISLFREDLLEADLGNSGMSLNTDSSKDQSSKK